MKKHFKNPCFSKTLIFKPIIEGILFLRICLFILSRYNIRIIILLKIELEDFLHPFRLKKNPCISSKIDFKQNILTNYYFDWPLCNMLVIFSLEINTYISFVFFPVDFTINILTYARNSSAINYSCKFRWDKLIVILASIWKLAVYF